MCEIYLAYLDNADWISNEPDKLIEKCNACRMASLSKEYHSFSFINGTGYVEKVRDEIELILQSNQNNCYLNSLQEFVDTWQIQEYLEYDLSNLSGGWKKYLSIALFTNIKSDRKLYFDSFRQLSDRLIALFIENLLSTSATDAFLLEYDTALFPAHLPVTPIFLRNINNDFSKEWATPNDAAQLESNYLS